MYLEKNKNKSCSLIKKIAYLIDYKTLKHTNNFQSNYDRILEILKSTTGKRVFYIK